MSNKANVYTEEFKSEAVSLARSRNSIQQASQVLGVSKSAIYRWVQQAGGLNPNNPDPQPGTQEALVQENKQLKKELAKLQEEQTILKKFVKYFTKELR